MRAVGLALWQIGRSTRARIQAKADVRPRKPEGWQKSQLRVGSRWWPARRKVSLGGTREATAIRMTDVRGSWPDR
jgi:hypothetical protein